MRALPPARCAAALFVKTVPWYSGVVPDTLGPSRQQVSTLSGPGSSEPCVKTVPLLVGEEAEPLVG